MFSSILKINIEKLILIFQKSKYLLHTFVLNWLDEMSNF